MTDEIKAGDKVTRTDGYGGEWTVEHLRGDWLWVFGQHSESGALAHVDNFTKVEPFFEAGKTYRDTDGELFDVEHVSERNGERLAFGWTYFPDDVESQWWDVKDSLGLWRLVEDCGEKES